MAQRAAGRARPDPVAADHRHRQPRPARPRAVVPRRDVPAQAAPADGVALQRRPRLRPHYARSGGRRRRRAARRDHGHRPERAITQDPGRHGHLHLPSARRERRRDPHQDGDQRRGDQRRKGRDLFDLWHVLVALDADDARIVAGLEHYMRDDVFTYPQLAQNLWAKIEDAGFAADLDAWSRRDPRTTCCTPPPTSSSSASALAYATHRRQTAFAMARGGHDRLALSSTSLEGGHPAKVLEALLDLLAREAAHALGAELLHVERGDHRAVGHRAPQ